MEMVRSKLMKRKGRKEEMGKRNDGWMGEIEDG
jgi:hypothetical protein